MNTSPRRWSTSALNTSAFTLPLAFSSISLTTASFFAWPSSALILLSWFLISPFRRSSSPWSDSEYAFSDASAVDFSLNWLITCSRSTVAITALAGTPRSAAGTATEVRAAPAIRPAAARNKGRRRRDDTEPMG